MRVSLVSALTLMVLGLFGSGCRIAQRSAVLKSASATSIQVNSDDPVSAEIPGDHVLVQTAVNGHDLRLILDTGATHVLVSPEIAAATGLKQTKEIPIWGLGGKERGSAGLAVAETLTVGSALGKKVPVLITPFPALFEADGLLGLSFLNHAIFRLDYQAQQLSFAALTNSTLPERGASIPMRIEGQLLTIPAEVDGTPVRLMVDTGASQTLTLKSWFVEEQKLRQRYPQRLNVVTGRGLFGLTHGEIARLQTLQIGGHSITNVCVEFGTKQKARRSKIAGMIGAGVLSQFTLTFDSAGKRLWLEPNARFGIDVPRSVVRSGLVCLPEGTNWMVLDVVANSPATEAGVRQGDRLIGIGGRSVSSLKNWEISRALLAKPGTLVQLRLQAGEEAPRDVTLKLRDLF